MAEREKTMTSIIREARKKKDVKAKRNALNVFKVMALNLILKMFKIVMKFALINIILILMENIFVLMNVLHHIIN